MRLLLLAATLAACGCASRPGLWRLANGVLTPPATLNKMAVPLCGSAPKVSPREALALRGEILRSEDHRCVPAGTADRTLARAIEHQVLPPQRAFDARYGSIRDAGHLDLAPGWRLRAIIPILKSGGFRVPAESGDGPGQTIEIDAKDEFLGMETAYYRLQPRVREPGVRIILDSVEATIDGKKEEREKPLAQLFGLPADARHVRLLYLTRRSGNDHDMAVIGGPTRQSLDEHSRCDGTPYCGWVPLGIAVLAQLPVTVDGATVWVAVGTSVREAIGTREPPTKLFVSRLWRGKPVSIEADTKDLWNLTLLGGDQIFTRR